jgi:hypothetical protein
MTVARIDDDSILLRKKKNSRRPTLFGIMKEKTGPVEHWPTVEEIKGIWE